MELPQFGTRTEKNAWKILTLRAIKREQQLFGMKTGGKNLTKITPMV